MPIKKIAKGNEEKEAQLLTIPGVMLNDSQDRVYPLGAAAGHLTGYVQAVTAEDLEKLENKGYHANSVIGRSGLEQAYEEELRPVDGTRIIIADETGNTIETSSIFAPIAKHPDHQNWFQWTGARRSLYGYNEK